MVSPATSVSALLRYDSWLEMSATEPLISIDVSWSPLIYSSTFAFLGDNLGLEKGDYSNRGYMCLSQYQMFSSLSLNILSVTSWDSSSQVMTVSVLWLSPCLSSEVMLKWNGHCDSWLTRRGLLDGLSCSTAAAIFRFKFDRDLSTCNKVYFSYQYVLYIEIL